MKVKRKILLVTALMLFLFPASVMASQMMVLIDVASPYAPDGAWKAVIVGSSSPYNETRFTVDPVIDNGRTLVPLRQVATALGYEVRWDAPNRMVTLIGHNLQEEDMTLKMKIDNNQAKLNDKTISMYVPPKIINNSTMIPLRFISESMGYFVKYVNGVIYITNYELLNESDFPTADSNENWTTVSSTQHRLKKEGVTSRGIKIGDSLDKVVQAYPRGNKYLSTFSDVLFYDSTIPYNTSSKAIVFAFKNGVVSEIYSTDKKPINAK